MDKDKQRKKLSRRIFQLMGRRLPSKNDLRHSITKAQIKELLGRTVRGNLSLRVGAYVTDDELNEERKHLLSHAFSSIRK